MGSVELRGGVNTQPPQREARGGTVLTPSRVDAESCGRVGASMGVVSSLQYRWSCGGNRWLPGIPSRRWWSAWSCAAPGGARDQSLTRPRPIPLAGHADSGRARTRSTGLSSGRGGLQAAGLPVAQGVVDDGQQLAGRGHLRDLGRGFPAPVPDPLLVLGHVGLGGALAGLDRGPPQQPRALLGDVPTAGLLIRGVDPRGQPSRPAGPPSRTDPRRRSRRGRWPQTSARLP